MLGHLMRRRTRGKVQSANYGRQRSRQEGATLAGGKLYGTAKGLSIVGKLTGKCALRSTYCSTAYWYCVVWDSEECPDERKNERLLWASGRVPGD
jgi:hypothetical protein